jgi:hypothetical protein
MNLRKVSALALCLLLAAATGVLAQISTGNIYGTVTDQSGAVLPGVTATLTGELGTRTTTSGPQGAFRFLNLPRGRYTVTLDLGGFKQIKRDVNVTTGENVELSFQMTVATQTETVEVTAESPIVDTKRRGTATTMTTEELQNVPNARDPWGVLKNVPGVLLDRINIAGNENGQQASVAGKGSTSGDKTWNLDGLTITDMSATGASPTYFDFGAFQEIAVTTGGGDLNAQTGGIAINLVTRRGTNKFRGSARYLIAHDDLSRSNLPDAIKGDPRLRGSDKADMIEQITDYGFDLGGPIVKDKLWFYGTYGKQDIRLKLLTQVRDKTLLPSYNGKLNWQASENTMVSAFYFLGSKQKFGRGVGFPVGTETDDFRWNQDNAFTDGGLPGGLWKLQIDQTFSSNFFVSAKAAYYDTGFGLFARGGPDKTYTVDYVAGEAIGSYLDYQAIRPQKAINVDANYFFDGLGGNNELKFGFGFRNTTTHSSSHYNGNQLGGIINSPTEKVAYVWRDGVTDYGGKYWSAYVGDTLSKNRWTFNAGARFDRQTARNFGSEAPANKSFPNVVPAVRFGGSDNLIEWNTISPRVGMSYALDDTRKTVLRASYANYAEQLSFGNVTDENPIAAGFLAYSWNDANNDRFVQPNEVNLGDFQYSFNINAASPGSVSSPHRIDSNLKPKRDHEVIVGLDREVGANFAVGAAYTWRRGVDWSYRPRLGAPCTGEASVGTCRVLGPSDYTQNAPSTANGFTAFTFSPNAALVTAGGSGRLRTNRDGYHTNFSGLELTLTKRLSNRWMGRMAFSFNDWTQHWDGTPTGGAITATSGNPTREERDSNVNGSQVAFLSGGSGKASFYTSVKWQFYANALVQLPWGVDLSSALFGKQGGPYPVSLLLSAGRDGTLRALAKPEVDTDRYDNVWDLDLRLAKTFKMGGEGGVTFAAEWFNVLNSGTVLSRSRFANSAAFTSTVGGAQAGMGRIEEILSPSIFRLGVSLRF